MTEKIDKSVWSDGDRRSASERALDAYLQTKIGTQEAEKKLTKWILAVGANLRQTS